MDKINSVNKSLDSNTLEKDITRKKQKDSFEIVIRGTEIFRINSQTKEIVQVFQCVDHCLRGNKTEELYSADFELMEHQFSVTGKEGEKDQYIVNVFGNVMFTMSIEKITGINMGEKAIVAEYEECLDEYVASFMMEKADTEMRVWITIN